MSNDHDLFPTASPHNAQMNQHILAELHRGEHATGGADRLSGSPGESAWLMWCRAREPTPRG
jgi:hypothetical protein